MTTVAINDFNGDHRSDILWRDGSNVLRIWTATATGGYVVGSVPGLPAQTLPVIAGDFNADGRQDLFFLGAPNPNTGETSINPYLQTIQSGFQYEYFEGMTLPSGWSLVATADFNGDGRTDLLTRNGSGQIVNWLAGPGGDDEIIVDVPSATFRSNFANMRVDVDLAWKVAGTGDFNGDGRGDILWRNDNGAIFDFLGTSNGGVVNNGDNSWMMIDNSWQIAGIGDFNGDGLDDILLRNGSGTITNYLAKPDGSFSDNSSRLYTTVGAEWHVGSIGDFNGDGRDDILWRNDNGAIFNFLGTATGGVVNNGDNSWVQVPVTFELQTTSIYDLFGLI